MVLPVQGRILNKDEQSLSEGVNGLGNTEAARQKRKKWSPAGTYITGKIDSNSKSRTKNFRQLLLKIATLSIRNLDNGITNFSGLHGSIFLLDAIRFFIISLSLSKRCLAPEKWQCFEAKFCSIASF